MPFQSISQYSKFVAFPHLKVNQASVCEAPLEITSFKKIAKFSHQNQLKMAYVRIMENITPWVKSFSSSEMRLNLTLAFLWSQWSKVPNVVLLFLSLEKMKYSSIRLNKILKCIVHKIVLEALCLDFTSYGGISATVPQPSTASACWIHSPRLGSHGLISMAKWQSFTKLEIFRTEEPKNRTSTNACTKAAMPGKWCRDADGRTDTTRHPPLIILN